MSKKKELLFKPIALFGWVSYRLDVYYEKKLLIFKKGLQN